MNKLTQLIARIPEEDAEMVRRIAAQQKVSQAEVLRTAIRRYVDLWEPAQPKRGLDA